jgi:hypothetical protein
MRLMEETVLYLVRKRTRGKREKNVGGKPIGKKKLSPRAISKILRRKLRLVQNKHIRSTCRESYLQKY